MAEYIKRDSVNEVLDGLVKRIEDSLNHSTQFGSGCDHAIRYISNKVEDIPAADVRPERHSYYRTLIANTFMGRLDKNREPIFQDRTSYVCAECGRGTIVKDNFCSHCGAKMDEKGDGE